MVDSGTFGIYGAILASGLSAIALLISTRQKIKSDADVVALANQAEERTNARALEAQERRAEQLREADDRRRFAESVHVELVELRKDQHILRNRTRTLEQDLIAEQRSNIECERRAFLQELALKRHGIQIDDDRNKP